MDPVARISVLRQLAGLDIEAAQLGVHITIRKNIAVIAEAAIHSIQNGINIKTFVFHIRASLRFAYVLQLYRPDKFMDGYLLFGVRFVVVAVQCAIMAEIRKDDRSRLVGVDIAVRSKVFAVEIQHGIGVCKP